MTQQAQSGSAQQIPSQNVPQDLGAQRPQSHRSGVLATTGSIVAGLIILMLGVLQAIMGITAMVRNEFFIATENELIEVDLTTWGWIHLILGALLVVTGIAVLLGKVWAMMMAMVLAILSAIDNFLFLPHYPLWSLVVIGLDILVIWALASRISAKTTS